jgi:hypothetical protein
MCGVEAVVLAFFFGLEADIVLFYDNPKPVVVDIVKLSHSLGHSTPDRAV